MEGIVCGSLCFDSCDITRMLCELARDALRLFVVVFSNGVLGGPGIDKGDGLACGACCAHRLWW